MNHTILWAGAAFTLGLLIPIATRKLIDASDRHLEQLLTDAYATDLDIEYRQLLEEDA